jgi:hypothetical protein
MICSYGVADGTRTHDDQNHNLGLYQLSYSHRRAREYSRADQRAAGSAGFTVPVTCTFIRSRSAR